MENRRCKTSQKKKNMSSPPPPPLPRLPGKVSRQNGGASVVVQWVVDVRGDYPEVTKTKQLAQFAPRALALLSPQERADVLKFIFPKDAKMALASKLLKRLAISSLAASPCPNTNTSNTSTNTDSSTEEPKLVPWHLSTPTRSPDTKPNFLLPSPTSSSSGTTSPPSEPLIFNVTHQAGLVVLSAALHPPPGTKIGVDVVCPRERRAHDLDALSRLGPRGFAEIYESVFSPREVDALCESQLAAALAATGRKNSEAGAAVTGIAAAGATGAEGNPDRWLRYFYTLWCLREAYVKMTGEALLASWLADLEMRNYAPPEVAAAQGDGLEVWFGPDLVRGVRKWLVNYGGSGDGNNDGGDGEFVICTFVRDGEGGEVLDFGEYVPVSLEDIVVAAEVIKRQSEAAASS